MPPEDRYEQAHRHSIQHRDEILRSDQCRCFYCLESFKPEDITEWVDEGQTAHCPRCGIDSVIGAASGVPLDDEFFGEMRKIFF